MKKKLLGIFVMTLLIASAVLPVVETTVRTTYLLGLDVSSHQGGYIQWDEVASSTDYDFKFAFVRATLGNPPDCDYNFETNMDNGDTAGLLMGAYHLACPTKGVANDAELEAEWFVQNTCYYLESSDNPKFLRPVLDLENNDYWDPGQWTKAELTQWVDDWMNYVCDETGVEPIIYTSPNFALSELNSEVSQYDLWIAHYRCSTSTPPNTAHWDDWEFWQYYEPDPENCGPNDPPVPGIGNNVDLDVFKNGNMNDLEAFRIPGNLRPLRPTDPGPNDGQTNIDIDPEMGVCPTLSVYVKDLDGDDLDVTFYDASAARSEIGTVIVFGGEGRAEIKWEADFESETEYEWYVVVYDGENQKQSDTWSFVTGPDQANFLPSVSTLDADIRKSNDIVLGVDLYGWLYNDGGGACWVRFRYKKEGDPFWTYLPENDWVGPVSSDTYFYNSISGGVLDPSAVYEFEAGAKNAITGEDGIWGFKNIFIAPNLPPMAKANGPYDGEIDELITFDASGSSDLNGDIIGYRWNFDGDEFWDTPWLTDPTTQHSFDEAGYYVAQLEVKDNEGATGFDGAYVTIYADPTEIYPPVVNTWNPSFTSPSDVTLRGYLAFDGGDDCQVRFRYRETGETDWIYPSNWHDWHNSGDPFWEDVTGLSTIVYEVQAGAKNLHPDEQWGDIIGFYYYNQLPDAEPGDSYSGITGEEITFDASDSFDPDGGITGYKWDWNGDNQWDTGWLPNPEFSHTYIEAGTYYARLIVKDDVGAISNADFAVVTVEDPPIIQSPQVQTLAASDISYDSATLNGKIVDDGGEDCLARFRYKEVGAPNWNDLPYLPGSYSTDDIFSMVVIGLSPSTDYEFQACAMNSAEPNGVWGNSQFFTTDSSPQILWEMTYGDPDNNEAVYDMQQTNLISPGFIMAGYQNTETKGAQVYLLKVDLNGNYMWSNAFGGVGNEIGYSLDQLYYSSGMFVVVGYSDTLWTVFDGLYWLGEGPPDFFLHTINSFGSPWYKATYGGEYEDVAYSVQYTPDRGYIITGKTTLWCGDTKPYLIKTNKIGTPEWTRVLEYWPPNDGEGRSVQQTSDGGYIVAGRSHDRACLIKTDSLGNEEWSGNYGTEDPWNMGNILYCVRETSDGYIAAGSDYVDSERVMWLVKTNANGVEQWNKTYPNNDVSVARSVQETSDGGYVLAGMNGGPPYSPSYVYVVRTDSDGNTLWTKSFGPGYNNEAHAIVQTADGNYVVAGWTRAEIFQDRDIYIAEIAPDSPRSCCVGTRGNANGDPNHEVNVADLTYLVDYLFNGGPEPPCFEEGDVNGDSSINVADMNHLVDYLFMGGPPPAACP